MKKMLMVLMMAFTMVAGLFAYEPKMECVTIKRNKVQYEETYTDCGMFTKTRMWAYNTKSGKFRYLRSGTFDDMWAKLLGNRKRYYIHLKVASFKDETCSTCAFIEKYKSAYENGELNETEMKQYESIRNAHLAANNIKGAIEGKPAHAKTSTKSYYETCANEEKRYVVNNMPFVTEENWLTITEEELREKIKDFCNM